MALAISLATGLLSSCTASGAGGGIARVGNDVSYPDCDGSLPRHQAFAIVGVNGGLAYNTNPCLAAELSWARTSTGTSDQPKVALYVNTANPRGAGGSGWWPTSDTFRHEPDGTATNSPAGTDAVTVPVPARYGNCAHGSDAACSYVYGYAQAYADVNYRVTQKTDPAGKPWMWWLDVETVNSWESGSAASLLANQADLEGMVAYFTSTGAHVGVYSTSSQWKAITGAPKNTTLAGLPSWLPGAHTLQDAISNCALPALTPGGHVTVTQYTSSIDSDYACRTGS